VCFPIAHACSSTSGYRQLIENQRKSKNSSRSKRAQTLSMSRKVTNKYCITCTHTGSKTITLRVFWSEVTVITGAFGGST